MDDATKTQIVEILTGMIIDLAPDATLRSMYGGMVVELTKDDPKSRVAGIYTYTGYVSLELSNGVSFDDPNGVLEGSGKLRRHVKLRDLEDIKTKGCRDFLRQALSMG
ncbi:MAG: DUF1801 domain-containing protein [Rhodobacteraceae bacterium]|nr:DUF1801 domain-containing protein [Paracoccaceae bacterium]